MNFNGIGCQVIFIETAQVNILNLGNISGITIAAHVEHLSAVVLTYDAEAEYHCLTVGFSLARVVKANACNNLVLVNESRNLEESEVVIVIIQAAIVYTTCLIYGHGTRYVVVSIPVVNLELCRRCGTVLIVEGSCHVSGTIACRAEEVESPALALTPAIYSQCLCLAFRYKHSIFVVIVKRIGMSIRSFEDAVVRNTIGRCLGLGCSV